MNEELINFIIDLSNGVNPITGEILPDDSFVNNAKSVRAFYQIKEILMKTNVDYISEKNISSYKNNENVELMDCVSYTAAIKNVDIPENIKCRKEFLKRKIFSEFINEKILEFVDGQYRTTPKGIANGIYEKISSVGNSRIVFSIQGVQTLSQIAHGIQNEIKEEVIDLETEEISALKSKKKLGISEIIKLIKAEYPKFNYSPKYANECLIKDGLLEVVDNVKHVTVAGKEYGIKEELRKSARGDQFYNAIYYDEQTRTKIMKYFLDKTTYELEDFAL